MFVKVSLYFYLFPETRTLKTVHEFKKHETLKTLQFMNCFIKRNTQSLRVHERVHM
jgi:hypothetical protein